MRPLSHLFRFFIMLFVAIYVGACSTPAPQQKDGKWLMIQLKTVADKGALFDPNRAGRLLDLKFVRTDHEAVKQPPSCSDPYSDSSRLVSAYSADNNWFKSLPGGRHEKYPGFIVNSPGETGDPIMTYEVTHATNCSGFSTVIHGTSATLSLGGLPSFACLTADDIGRTIGAHLQLETDGFSSMVYTGKTDDDSGTSIEFSFRAGASCALDVRMEQNVKDGLRFARAKWNFDECDRIERRKFCSTHAPFTWSQGDVIDEMNRATIQACGTVDAYFAKERRTGERPPPPARPRNYTASPCDMP